ncbi:MAG TPA: hypothetical protein VM305_08305 [Candidatus Limnocylindrales bacterium]|nr:hypothetical protein [Candidatus Limnocylindrales bacterium]
MNVLTAIPLGRSNARTKREIADVLGTVPRDVEAEIERLRKSGEAAICSDGSGYWQPLTAAEYADNVQRRRRRAMSQLVTVRGERRLVRRWEAREAEPLAFRWDAA